MARLYKNIHSKLKEFFEVKKLYIDIKILNSYPVILATIL